MWKQYWRLVLTNGKGVQIREREILISWKGESELADYGSCLISNMFVPL